MTFSPVSSIYAQLLEARVRRASAGAIRLGPPIISVGNLTMGGTGKTPMVESLALHFQSLGRKPAILSRGYGRSSRQPTLVSGGDGPRVGAEQGGDEPVALARRLPGVIVAVARRRVDAAHLAAELGADLFLLDDGFQHVALARDVDVLLIDARDPFGGEKFPPRGRLREPMSALARADAFVLTHAEPEVPLRGAEETLAFWNPLAPIFHARLPASGLWDENGSPISTSQVASQRAIAVCGIAQPRGFTRSLEDLGISALETLVFRDHQRYRSRHIARIRRAAERTAASWLMTTEKDAVKLAGRIPLAIACVRRRIEIDEPAFFPFLESRVAPAVRQATARPLAQ